MFRILRDNILVLYKRLKLKVVRFKEYEKFVVKNNLNKLKYYNRNIKLLFML